MVESLARFVKGQDILGMRILMCCVDAVGLVVRRGIVMVEMGEEVHWMDTENLKMKNSQEQRVKMPGPWNCRD
jgi:hypothetical protein